MQETETTNKNKPTTLTVVDNIQQLSLPRHSLADTFTIPFMYNPVLWNNFLKKPYYNEKTIE